MHWRAGHVTHEAGYQREYHKVADAMGYAYLGVRYLERREENPLWALIYERGTQEKKPDLRAALTRLPRFPLDHIHWTVTNSQRADVPLDVGMRRGGCRWMSCRMRRWNSIPCYVDGGEGGREAAENTAFLPIYWMASYIHLLKARSRRRTYVGSSAAVRQEVKQASRGLRWSLCAFADGASAGA